MTERKQIVRVSADFQERQWTLHSGSAVQWTFSHIASMWTSSEAAVIRERSYLLAQIQEEQRRHVEAQGEIRFRPIQSAFDSWTALFGLI